MVPFRQLIIYPCHGSQGEKLWTLLASWISPLPSRYDSSLLVAHSLWLSCIQTHSQPNRAHPIVQKWVCIGFSPVQLPLAPASQLAFFRDGSQKSSSYTPALSIRPVLSQGFGSESYVREERPTRDRPSEDLPRQRNLVWEALVPWDSLFLSQQGGSHSIPSSQLCN